MGDSANESVDISKMKVIELRRELKSRGLPTSGDKNELVTRLQNALHPENEFDLDSDEIDSDGVLDDEYDDKSQLEVSKEELALIETPTEKQPSPPKPLKRKLQKDEKQESKETAKKIVLNRPPSVPSDTKIEPPKEAEQPKEANSEKVKINFNMDDKSRLELRAKRFGLPETDEARKEARKIRFGLNSGISGSTAVVKGATPEELEKLKKRAERFGVCISKKLTVIENEEKLQKRREKFGLVK